jgi:hypothetical protein
MNLQKEKQIMMFFHSIYDFYILKRSELLRNFKLTEKALSSIIELQGKYNDQFAIIESRSKTILIRLLNL